MNKAVFLDRDGVINDDKDLYYVTSPDEFQLSKGIITLMSHIKEKGYLTIVVSNQGGISKKLYTKEDVEAIHDKMKSLLLSHGLTFNEIYYCSHHPDEQKCICRKPGTLFIEKAISRFGIDPSLSYFVGDRDSDVETGKNTGLTSIKVVRNTDISYLKEIIS